MNVVELKNVWEKYSIKFISQKEIWREEFWALEDINLEVKKGEALGIIGANGAGKTTLLKLIAGMLIPDRGEIVVKGRVATIMELGVGFNPEFTGKENIILNAHTYGLDKESLNERIEKIIEFSGLGKFIYAPIKYYSQGMFLRLAFSLAIHADPDILLIDDILAVGDKEAQEKCINKIFELKREKKTIILVSYDMNMISKLCDRVILLEKGKIVYEGIPQKTIFRYLETIGDKKGISILEENGLRIIFNNGRISISYKDFSITKRNSCIFYFNPLINSWISSLNLSWRIKETGFNKIIAEGEDQKNSLSQIWNIQLKKSYLHLEIKISGAKEPHLDFSILPEYKKWITLKEEKEFPPFISKTEFQNLGLDTCPEGVIGIKPENTQNFPYLIFERRDNSDQIKIFNTGYEEEARIVQLPLNNNKLIIDIKIISEEDEFEKYIENKKEKLESKILSQRTLTSRDLKVYTDIEKKAVRIYYKDLEITEAVGLHTSFLIDNNWHGNSEAEWQIERKNSMLILQLNWEKLKINQKWEITLKDNSLFWQIESEIKSPLNLKLFKFGIFLSEKYKSFFSRAQQENFPEGFDLWQEMKLKNVYAELIGVRKKEDYPAVVLENKNRLQVFIQNSDSSLCSRVLQLATSSFNQKNPSFSVQLKFLEEESLIENYIKKEQLKILSQRTLTSRDLKVYTDIEKKAVRIYYKDLEITKNKGLYTAICLKEKGWVHSFDSSWQIEKRSEKELVLILKYEKFLSEIWHLSCQDNVLEIKIKLSPTAFFTLLNRDLRLEVFDKYEKWITAYKEGYFLSQHYGDIIPIRLEDNKVSKIMLREKDKLSVPNLYFETLCQPYGQILGVYKNKKDKYICLNFSSMISKKENYFYPGKYIHFLSKIIFGKAINLKEAEFRERVEISKNNLKFIFDEGRTKIFWKEKEITQGLGVYTSLRSSGVWYDSYQAKWEIVKKEKDKLTLHGDWIYLPISQIWNIELKKENLIYWKIDIEIYEEVDLEIEQASIMLSLKYEDWRIPRLIQNKFLDEFPQDYDILPFRFWYGKSERIEVFSETEELPKVLFECKSEEKSFRAIIGNSDYFYKARLIQYQRSNIQKKSPGKYSYFEGVIEIES